MVTSKATPVLSFSTPEGSHNLNTLTCTMLYTIADSTTFDPGCGDKWLSRWYVASYVKYNSVGGTSDTDRIDETAMLG